MEAIHLRQNACRQERQIFERQIIEEGIKVRGITIIWVFAVRKLPVFCKSAGFRFCFPKKFPVDANVVSRTLMKVLEAMVQFVP